MQKQYNPLYTTLVMQEKDWNGIIINWLIKGIKGKPLQDSKQNGKDKKRS